MIGPMIVPHSESTMIGPMIVPRSKIKHKTVSSAVLSRSHFPIGSSCLENKV